MKKSTIERIIRNAVENRIDTIIGKYTYRFNVNTGAVSRCLTDDVCRAWIETDGSRSDAWAVIAQM